jgi:hypothetical protein
MIILTKEQRDLVEGYSTPNAKISCLPIGNDKYYLPEAVLQDPKHASKYDILLQCEIRELTDDEENYIN